MNERIRELQTQAFDLCKTHEGKMVVTDEVFEKFAQLIVEECASTARNADLEEVDGGDSAVLTAASAQILKHFGVK